MKYKLWIERSTDGNPEAIRIDWENDRHQRVKITGGEAVDLEEALLDLSYLLRDEINEGEIS